jgi:ribonuclease HI
VKIYTTTSRATIAELASSWGIGPWDAILVGDGSGSGRTLPIGWGCVLIDKGKGRKPFYGGCSSGTSHIAEIMPYIQALEWYATRCGVGGAMIRRVHIVTDAKAVATIGNDLLSGAKVLSDTGPTIGLWAALMAYDRIGLSLKFHWVPRASSTLNCYADAYARICYRAMKAMPAPSSPEGRTVNTHECNPATVTGRELPDFGPPAEPPKHRSGKRKRRDCPAEP